MVFKNENDLFYIYDWKRVKKISKQSNDDRSVIEEIKHLDNSNFIYYALQLNTYRLLLEKNYGTEVASMSFVTFHPDKKQFKQHDCPDFTHELLDMLKMRCQNLYGNKYDE